MNTPQGGKASSSGQRKKLPVNPSLEHLQKQAKRRVKQHPALKLAEAQHQLAQEYGCKNWAGLARMVETMSRGADQLANVKREIEPLPKAARAVDIARVRQILAGGNFTQHDLDQALSNALWYGEEPDWPQRKELADLLLDHGADPDGQYGGNYGPVVFGTGECLQPAGLQYLIDAGADVTFGRIATKYGAVCPLDHALGTYVRGRNDRKHRVIDILLRNGAHIPAEVTPPILAIHRGDAGLLAELLDREPGLISRRFPEMPYGNIRLRGATLLHCAVEFGEIACLEELFKRHADINLKAQVIDGIGGQTPVFHAINTNCDGNFSTLEYLVKKAGPWIDLSVRATWNAYGEVQPKAMNPWEYAQSAANDEARAWRKHIDAERALLQSLDSIVRAGNSERLEAMLESDPSLAQRDSEPGRTLSVAARNGRPEIVQLLLAHGADPGEANEKGNTPLWSAAQSPAEPAADRIAVMALLLNAGADIHHRCEDGSTALHAAAWRGPCEVVEFLLSHGARSWVVDDEDQTPLDYARKSVSPDRDAIVRLFTEVRILDPIFREAVQAIDKGDVENLKKLLLEHPGLIRQRAEEEGWYAGTYFRHPMLLHFVANNPYRRKTMPPRILESAEAILDAGADIHAKTEAENDHGVLGLVTSCEPARKDGLQIPLIELLVRRGADPSTGLDAAIVHGETEAVQALLRLGAKHTLISAAAMGETDVLARHLAKTPVESLRFSALFAAARFGCIASVELLLDSGLAINARNESHPYGPTVLHEAAWFDQRELVEWLLDRGADPTARDRQFNGTPASWATHANHPGLAAFLQRAEGRYADQDRPCAK